MLNDTTRAIAVAALEFALDHIVAISEVPEIYVDYTSDEFEACVKAALADLNADAPQAQAAQCWKPVEAYSEVYVVADDDEKYTIGVDGDDTGYILRHSDQSIACLPDKWRLCRQMPAPVAQGVDVPLDFPDGPGWWAGRTKSNLQYIGGRKFFVWFTEFKVIGSTISICWGEDDYSMIYSLERFKLDYADTEWYKLTMPWDAPAPQAEEMPK